jgi:methylglutaconyl-CoA hydratase
MEALRVEREGPVLRVTLARPEKRNAFDGGLIRELTSAFADVGDARAVVLAGDGPSFSAGADLEWMRASVDLPYEANLEEAVRVRRMLLAVDGCPAPVVARVHGHALGGAVGLIACADIAVASPGTVFGLTEVRVGIIPAAISPFVLARIGPGAARRYFLTGERFAAAEAHRIGLVHEIADDLDRAVDSILAALLESGPEAVAGAKRLILDAPLGDETAERIAESRASAEGQEGISAFLERREPAFREAWPRSSGQCQSRGNPDPTSAARSRAPRG